MRTTWRAVGGICRRVSDEARGQRDLLGDLRRLGFDEISVRKGQSYLTVVVDHHSGRLVWAAPGRDRKTVEKFLDLLGALSGELAHSHPGAAASLREGLEETMTLQRLGVHEQLWRTLGSVRGTV
jgi:hypothetical protein